MDAIPYIRRAGVCISAYTVLSYPTQYAFVNAHLWMKFTRDDTEKREVLKSIYQEAKKYYANSAGLIKKIPEL